MDDDSTTDCHVHVFGDRSLYPVRVPSAYEPPASPLGALADVAASAGVGRVVLVQPTPYGSDLSLLEASLAASNGRARGVGVAPASTPLRELARLRDAGIVALRFVGMKLPDGSPMPGTVPIDALCGELAPKLRQLGMHAEVWAPLPEVIAQWPRLERCGIPIVLDHMGGFDPASGPRDPDFRRLIGLLKDGALWLKLAICRRTSGPSYALLRPFHDEMVEANSARLVWASDFPFVRYPGMPPTVPELLAQFHRWVADKEIAHRILKHNPAHLYRFEQRQDNPLVDDQS